MEVKLSLDSTSYQKKPEKTEMSVISNRLVKSSARMELSEVADLVGNQGYSFCPAVFNKGGRKKEDFKEMQLFGLDFDRGISFEEVQQKAKHYELPIAFAYQTLSSSISIPKFRVVFLNDLPVMDNRVAEIMIALLLGIFSEADQACKDVSRMFLGGKGLIGSIKEEPLHLDRLAFQYQSCMFEADPKNYLRPIKNLAQKHNVGFVNNVLQIFCTDNNGENEGFLENDLYIYGSETKFPSNSVKYYIHSGYNTGIRSKNESFSSVRVELAEIKERCQLYHDFTHKKHLHHNHTFLLLTNLLQIDGGQKIFRKCIKTGEYDIKKWEYALIYAKGNHYRPQSCSGNCPYDDQCRHKTNMVCTLRKGAAIRKVKDDEVYCTVEEAYNHICINLEDAVNQPRKGIYLIKAQTAVGKTQSYCELLMRESDKRFIIAVPTNILKREIETRLRCNDVDVLVTMSLDEISFPDVIRQKVQTYYKLGLEENVAQLIQTFMKQYDGDSEFAFVISQCEEYLNLNSNLEKHRNLITTHSRLATLSRDIIDRYTVIIDEDILSTFFKNIRSVPMSTVISAVQTRGFPDSLYPRLNQIINLETERYSRFDEPVTLEKLSEEELNLIEAEDNLNGIFQATTFFKEKDKIHYFIPRYLPDGKYIVLSATHELPLYKKYFGDRYIYEYPCCSAEYKGKIKQYTAHTMSRQDMKGKWNQLGPIFEKIDKTFSVITFMEFEDHFHSTGLHFGNTEGIDSLKGKDIAIIGTPHQAEFVYKLIGLHLKLQVDKETLAQRKIVNRGYEFTIMTYKENELRKLQLYFIRKELEQSIGRARLLRNACRVYVLSNFPCDQAEIIQEDYIEEDSLIS